MNEQSSKQSIFVVLAIIMSIVLIYVLFVPGLRRLTDMSVKTAAKKNDLQIGRQKIDDLKAAAETLSQKSAAVEALNIAVPPQKDTAGALVQIAQMVSDAGLAVQSIQPNPNGAKAGALPMTVVVQGRFTDLVKFSEIVEKNLRPVQIKTINIASSSGEEGSGLSASYAVELVYFMGEEKVEEEVAK